MEELFDLYNNNDEYLDRVQLSAKLVEELALKDQIDFLYNEYEEYYDEEQ